MRVFRPRRLLFLSVVILVLATGCGGGSEAPPPTVYGPTTTTLDPERPSDVSLLPLLLKELSRINVGGSAAWAEVTVDGRKYSFAPDPDHPNWTGCGLFSEAFTSSFQRADDRHSSDYFSLWVNGADNTVNWGFGIPDLEEEWTGSTIEGLTMAREQVEDVAPMVRVTWTGEATENNSGRRTQAHIDILCSSE
jgi:hypothetical protein